MDDKQHVCEAVATRFSIFVEEGFGAHVIYAVASTRDEVTVNVARVTLNDEQVLLW